jgi:hypothetical protein
MGMDVYGRNPTSKEGEYFRNNVWWWRPLAEYCMEVAPEIAARCEGWHYNDGDGLNGLDSGALAEACNGKSTAADVSGGRKSANQRLSNCQMSHVGYVKQRAPAKSRLNFRWTSMGDK